jgi:Zn-dependent peptidase ImmA (M78 family)
MTDLNQISSQEIGRRLRLARENANVRQDNAAKVIGLSRPTLVSIEKGARRIRIKELQSLASHYGVSVNALLRREAVHTDLLPRFRRLSDNEDELTNEAVQLLNDIVKADVELENVLGIHRKRNYPPERGISAGDVIELAEKHAQELRDWLDLGLNPIADIFTLIELNLGIRLYQRRLSSKSKISGLFAFDESVGACILLNANHPWERRVQSAAHELGHFVGTRLNPEVLEVDERFLSREERYAHAFGRAFLTPRDSFSDSFRRQTEGASKFTRRHVILLAHQFNISREACVRRLEDLQLRPKGTWDWFKANGGISKETVKSVLGELSDRPDPAKEDANKPVAQQLALRAYEAWSRDLMSEGQLAELLKVPRVELRDMLDQIEREESEMDDLLKLTR